MKKASQINISKLKPFKDHPYKVKCDEEMVRLIRSIRDYGILSPLIVNKIDNDNYEVISGHRRLYASKQAGITEIPAFIYSLDNDTASIMVVDSNLHRDKTLPSEKAYAYKMKMEALSHQRKNHSGQLVPQSNKKRTATEVGKSNGESYKTVQRYIRLTHLIPEILEYVDVGRISFTPAVELSYLRENEQFSLLEIIKKDDCTPSLSQAVRMKKLSQAGMLNGDIISEIMMEEKANQKERIKIPVEEVKKYFPENYSILQIKNEIIKLCKDFYNTNK